MKLSLSTSLSGFTKSAVPFVGVLDGYATGLGGVYSISRRLRSSYTGPLIRVRRSSDDAELDIGFTDAGLLDTAALLVFAGAGEAYLVTIYDQSGLGRDVTCPTAAQQLRIVNTGTLETTGAQSRPCARAATGSLGPYISATFTTNSSATLTAVSSFYLSAPGSDNRYLSLAAGAALDWNNADSIAVFLRRGSNARVASYSILEYNPTDVTYGALSASNRATGSELRLNCGAGETAAAFFATIGYSRVVIAGSQIASGGAGADDRHMEHVIWQTDIGAPAAAAIRAEQEAFYA